MCWCVSLKTFRLLLLVLKPFCCCCCARTTMSVLCLAGAHRQAEAEAAEHGGDGVCGSACYWTCSHCCTSLPRPALPVCMYLTACTCGHWIGVLRWCGDCALCACARIVAHPGPCTWLGTHDCSALPAMHPAACPCSHWVGPVMSTVQIECEFLAHTACMRTAQILERPSQGWAVHHRSA